MTDLHGDLGAVPAPNFLARARAWFFAARPDSFVASSMPVLSTLALAWRDCDHGRSGSFLIAPAICCLFFAVLGQAAANLMNDYSDYRTGANPSIRETNEKIGVVNRRSLLFASLLLFFVAVAFGAATIPYGGTTIIFAGLIFGAICLLYSVGPFPLSEIGLGDLAVFVTFGLGATVFTYYLQTSRFSVDALALGVVYGLAINNILVANTFADYEEDRSIGKKTTIVLLGKRFGRALYLASGIVVTIVLGAFYTSRSLWGFFSILSLALYVASFARAYATTGRPDYTKKVGLAQAGMSVAILGATIPLAILF